MGERASSKIFPEIPRWPESNFSKSFEPGGKKMETVVLPEEPALEGTPSKEEESIFLSIPELGNVVEAVVRYKAFENIPDRKKFVHELVKSLMADPFKLADFLDGLELAEQTEIYKTKRFKKEIKAAIMEADMENIPLGSHECLGWLELCANSKVYKEIAEYALRAAFAARRDEKALIDLTYDIALVGAKSGDESVTRKVLQILGRLAPIMPPKSRASNLFELAKWSQDKDVQARYREIESLIEFLLAAYPDLQTKVNSIIKRARSSEPYQKALQGLADENRTSLETAIDLKAMPDSIPLKDKKEAMERAMQGDFSMFPDSFFKSLGVSREVFESKLETAAAGGSAESITIGDLIPNRDFLGMVAAKSNKGPLGQWLDDRIARELNQKTEHHQFPFHLPGLHSVVPDSPSLISNFVDTYIKEMSPLPDAGVLSEEQYWNTLARYVPEGMFDRKNALEISRKLREYNTQLVREMRTDSVHLLSPRGDIVVFDDPILVQMGFKQIEFRMDPINKKNTIVRITVGHVIFEAVVDEYYSIQERNDTDNSLCLTGDGQFLRSIILAHLHAIRCTDLITDVDDTSAKESAEKKLARRGHRRILPEGHNPTREQIITILRKYQIDIIRMNQERDAEAAAAGRKNTRKITYVSPVDSEEDTRPPVKSNAPRAFNYIHSILETKA